MILQKTLINPLTLIGKGLHTGSFCVLKFIPAEVNHGILFKINGTILPAHFKYVINTRRAVTLGKNGCTIQTVEHLLSALSGMGITNLLIDAEGSEIPILDGSAKSYCDRFLEAGITEQDAPVRILSVDRTIAYSNSESGYSIQLSPYDGLKISYTFMYKQRPLQKFSFDLTADSYYDVISGARTFCFVKDIEYLHKQNLIRGAEMESGFVVLDEEGCTDALKKRFVLPPDETWIRHTKPFKTASMIPSRYENEMVRHKILDLIGDLSLSGYRIGAHVNACGTGHYENIEMLKILLAPDVAR